MEKRPYSVTFKDNPACRGRVPPQPAFLLGHINNLSDAACGRAAGFRPPKLFTCARLPLSPLSFFERFGSFLAGKAPWHSSYLIKHFRIL